VGGGQGKEGERDPRVYDTGRWRDCQVRGFTNRCPVRRWRRTWGTPAGRAIVRRAWDARYARRYALLSACGGCDKLSAI